MPGLSGSIRDPGNFAARKALSATVERLMVNDGGVYDNMADQWHQGFAARSTVLSRSLPAASYASTASVASVCASWKAAFTRPLACWLMPSAIGS